jgi:hypothetical protein
MAGKKATSISSSTKDRVRSSQDIHLTGAISSNKKVLTPSSKSNIPANKITRKSTSSKLSSKDLGIERRKAMSTHGKSALNTSDRTRNEVKKAPQVIAPTPTKKINNSDNQNNNLISKNIKRRVTQKKKAHYKYK